MTESNLSRDTYYVDYQRDLDVFRDDNDSTSRRLADLRTRFENLLHLTEEIERILCKQRAIICCLQFFICILRKRPYRLPGLEKPCNATALPPSRPDTDDHVPEPRVLVSSAERQQFIDDPDDSLLKLVVDLVRWEGRRDGGRFEGPRLLYRVHRPSSHTFYNEDVGFCCGRWHRGRDIEEPSKWDFYHHASGHRSSSKGAFETPYISMTSSPTRALNLVSSDEMQPADVFVIDAELLWATNIDVERTTDVADRHGIRYKGPGLYGRAHYITDTHWVAQYWIPADCIVKRMSFHHFQEICSKNSIFRGTDYLVHYPSPEHDSLMTDTIGDPNGAFDEGRLSLRHFEHASGLHETRGFSNTDPFELAAMDKLSSIMEAQVLALSSWQCDG